MALLIADVDDRVLMQLMELNITLQAMALLAPALGYLARTKKEIFCEPWPIKTLYLVGSITYWATYIVLQ